MSIRLKCILLMLLPVTCGLTSIVAATYALNCLEHEYTIHKHSAERVLNLLALEEKISNLVQVLSNDWTKDQEARESLFNNLTAAIRQNHQDLPVAVSENPRLAPQAKEMDELCNGFLKLVERAQTFARTPNDTATMNRLKMDLFSLGLTARSTFGDTEEAEDWLQSNSIANLKHQEQLFLPFLFLGNLMTLAATAAAILIFNRQLIEPLHKLKEQIEGGNLAQQEAQKEEEEQENELPAKLRRLGSKGDEISRLNQEIQTALEEICELNQSELAIVQYSGDVLCSLNTNGIFTRVNKSCETFWGYPADSLVGQSLEQIIAESSLPAILKMLNKAKIEGGVRSLECQHLDVSGIDTFFLWTIHWVKEEGEFLCVCHDITQKHQLQSLRENICATLSHDMRTPLMSMSTSIELLLMKNSGDSPRQVTLLKDSSQLAQKLTKLVTDVLDWKKIESGNLGLTELEIDCLKLTTEVAERLETLYPVISIDLVNEQNSKISGDNSLLERAFLSIFELLISRVVRSQQLTMVVKREAKQKQSFACISAFLPDATNDGDFSKAPAEQLIDSDSIMAMNLPMSFYLVENIIRNHGGTIAVIVDQGFIQKATVRLPIRSEVQL
jgi:PAS domain S-box-containing protein